MNLDPSVRPLLPAGAGVLLALLVALLPVDAALAAGQLRVGSGATLDTGSGQLDLGCGSLQLDGQASGRWSGIDSVTVGSGAVLGTERLDFGGNWQSMGAARIPGTVAWVDACARSPAALLGDNDFDSLLIHSPTGLERRLDANGSKRIRQALSLQGGAARLRLASTSAGVQASVSLDFGASQDVNRIEVRDIDSTSGQTIAPGRPADFDSVNAGNNRNWFIELVAIPVPTLGALGLGLMALLLLFVARRRLGDGPSLHA